MKTIRWTPLLLVAVGSVLCGCSNAIRNGWLQPQLVGGFDENRTTSIRSALTVEDTPSAIPGATEPTAEDLVPLAEEPEIQAGDDIAVEIMGLRQVLVPYQARFRVNPVGQIAIPQLGRVNVAGKTASQLERELARRLVEEEILPDPDVIVIPLVLNEYTYSIFGIGVSAANNAPLRAGTFPISRPDLRVLEAINLVGGLNEFVTEVYVFRADPEPPLRSTPARRPGDRSSGTSPMEQAPPDGTRSGPAAELIDAVVHADEPIVSRLPSQDALTPEKPSSYIFTPDGEFVENPELGGSGTAAGYSANRVPSFEALQSRVDWSRLAGDSHYRVIRIPADALRSNDREYNIVVRPLDVIRIVSGEIGEYYVMGQVVRSGSFRFNAEQITLKSAIASAGGLGPLAWPTRCSIYRHQGLREQLIQVDLDAIFAGKEDDLIIRRGDIVNVGTSPFAPFLARLRQWTLPNPAATLGYSFTYSRNFADIDSFAVQPNPATRPNRFEGLFP